MRSEFTQDLPAGRSVIQKEIPLLRPDGFYDLTVTLDGKVRWEESFYKYDPSTLDRMKSGIQALAQDETDLVLRNSVDALTYRLAELQKAMDGFTERNNPEDIQRELEALLSLYEACKSSGSIYTQGGYLLSTFRSPLDSTLQPFSIYLPEHFDPEKSYDLLVGLHGSGVDEVGFLRWTVRTFGDEDFIVVGPRGRDLSGWYLGVTETDVVDLVELTKRMFRIDHTLLYGFSMGGYGVWRMSFFHPELFDGAICVSGPPSPWRGDREANDMRNHIGKGKTLKYLVIHGTDDHAVDIQATDDFMEKLKEAGYDLEYVRVPGGGHGNFGVKEMVKEWMKKHFKDETAKSDG